MTGFSLVRVSLFLVVAALLSVCPAVSLAQRAEVTVSDSTAVSGADPLAQAMTAAQTLLEDGLATMNEETLRRAAMEFEAIAENYNDPRVFDAYFTAVHIYMQYLQTEPDYRHAQNLLTLLINNHPSNYPIVVDALITRAHLEYRCLRDYRAAQTDISTILNSASLAAELGTRDVEVKVLLAKCRQKLGEYDRARSIWNELAFGNPELDTEGRAQWIDSRDNWFLVNDGRIRLFFERGVERETYVSCLSGVRDGLTRAEAAWGVASNDVVDVYLYSSSDSLFDYTTRRRGFALPEDAEIHMSPSDIQQAGHLASWVLSHELSSRPAATMFPVLRAGIQHYFSASRAEIDRQAAHEIYYYGGRIPDYELLFPLSFDYTFTDEYANMAASFLHYLIEDRGLDTNALRRFYRLLWSKPGSRLQPPAIAWLSRLFPDENQTAMLRGESLSAEQVYGLFQSVLGLNLGTELANWQSSLSDEIAAVEAELGSLTAEVERVRVDLSTPEKALETWWNAYRAGDFDALIEASTSEMAEVLRDARDLYREQGILEQVIIDNFIRPYRSARMVVVQQGQFADTLYVFQIQIVRGDETRDMTIAVRKEGNLWKIDSN